MPTELDQPHDVFISYAREDLEWVSEHLYKPLLRCRTRQGRPPRVFFDLGEHGIRIGQNYMGTIAAALQTAHKVVPVYSHAYFSKEMTRYELELAHSRDVNGNKNILLPILREAEAASQIPYAVHLINYWPCADPDWFEKLCHSLELKTSPDVLTLEFIDQPGDLFVNHTLPVVRVAIRNGQQTAPYDEEITIRGENASLQGSTSVTAEQGIAVFDDLSIGSEVEQTRLIASCASIGQAVSEPFSVFRRPERTSQPSAPSGRVSVESAMQLMFFEHGRALAILRDGAVETYSLDGSRLLPGPLPVRAPIRIVRRRQDYLVLADWSGMVLRLHDDGRYEQWDFRPAAGGFVVPADVDIAGDDVFVGFWNGSVFRLKSDGGTELVLRDDDGVQALGVSGERLFSTDFSGNLRVYRQGKLVNADRLESAVWLLKEVESGLLAVGEERFYHIDAEGTRVLPFDMPLSGVSSVYELSDLPVAIDATGKGIRFDCDLIISQTFYTKPGAEPVSADKAGVYCVFRNPDDSRTLMVKDRIVFTHAEGVLAVSPDGEMFAVGDQREIRLFDQTTFRDIMQRQSAEPSARSQGTGVTGRSQTITNVSQ